MPTTYQDNFYQPQTAIGAGLSNISRALFSGPTPLEQEKLRAERELKAAHAGYYNAGTDKLRAEAEQKQFEIEQQKTAEQRLAEALFGNQPTAQKVLNYGKTGSWGPEQFRQTGYLSDPSDMVPAPQPAEITPEAMQRWQNVRAAQAGLQGTGGAGKATSLDDMVKLFYGQDLQNRALAGDVTQPQAQALAQITGALAGTGAFKDGQHGMGNQYTGTLVDPRLFNADAGATEALRTQRNAAASASGAAAQSARLVPVLDNDGNVVWARAADAAGQRVGRTTPKADAPTKPLSKGELDSMDAAIENIAGGPVDPAVGTKIKTRAVQIALDPNSEWHRNPGGAVEAAMQELAPGGFQEQGKWNPFVSNTFVPKGGAPAPQQPGIPTANMTPQRAQQLVQEANDAIARGAPREAVMARLKQMGVETQ